MSHEVSQEGMFLLENEEGTGFKGTGRQLLFCACVNCWCCIATHTLPSSEPHPASFLQEALGQPLQHLLCLARLHFVGC